MFYNKYYGGNDSTNISDKRTIDILNEIYNKFSEKIEQKTSKYKYENFKDIVTSKYFIDKFITCIRSPYKDKKKLEQLQKLICNSNVMIDFYNIPKKINSSFNYSLWILSLILILLILNIILLIIIIK